MLVDDESKLKLHGLLQYYIKVDEPTKLKKLIQILDTLEFNQVVIFVKSVDRAKKLKKYLVAENFPTVAIHSGMDQQER